MTTAERAVSFADRGKMATRRDGLSLAVVSLILGATLVGCGGGTDSAEVSPTAPVSASPSAESSLSTESPTSTLDPSGVASQFRNDTQLVLRDHGVNGVSVTLKTVRNLPGYGSMLVLGVSVHGIGAVKGLYFTMLAIGETAPDYEDELASLDVQYIAFTPEDAAGGTAIGAVDDFVANGNGEINATQLHSRLFYEGT
jgi:hypothetical protein